MPRIYRISSAVPAPPGNTTMPWPRRTKASSRFSISGSITRSLTMGVGDSAAIDARFRDSEIAAAGDALLGMTYGCAFHRSLHGARSAAGTNIHPAQAKLIPDRFRIIVFDARYRMATPADHQIGVGLRAQYIGIAQNMEYGVGDSFRSFEIELRVVVDFLACEKNIAQHGKQVFVYALDHLVVDICAGWRSIDVVLDAALALIDANVV